MQQNFCLLELLLLSWHHRTMQYSHKYEKPQTVWPITESTWSNLDLNSWTEIKETEMSRMLLTGEPGIKGLACDWLNGNLFWTNQKTESIYMQAAAGKGYATLLSKNISPSELVLLPVERCVWLLFSLCYTGFKSSRLKYYWYHWLLLNGKSTSSSFEKKWASIHGILMLQFWNELLNLMFSPSLMHRQRWRCTWVVLIRFSSLCLPAWCSGSVPAEGIEWRWRSHGWMVQKEVLWLCSLLRLHTASPLTWLPGDCTGSATSRRWVKERTRLGET